MSTINVPSISPSLLRQIIDAASEAFIVSDRNDVILVWSAGAERLLGWSAQEAIQRRVSDLIIPERLRERHRAGINRYVETRESRLLERPIRVQALHRHTDEIAIELKVSVLTLGEEFFFCASIQDSLAALDDERSSQHQATLLNLSEEGMIACDVDLKILYWNKGAEKLYGYRREEALGRHTYDLLKTVYPLPLSDIRKQLHETRSWEGALINKDRNGRKVTVLSRWALEYDTHGEPMRILIKSTDLTHSKQYLDKVEHLATHDALTKLPNRTLLERRMEEAIAKAQKQRSQMAVMFLDLNGFKQVNDSLGHEQGDLLLQVVAQRLLHVVRDGDTVSRIGGDEFVICLHQIDSAEAIQEIGDRVLKTISQPIHLKTGDAVISTSVGVAIFPKDGASTSTLIKHADTAMYQSKAFGPAKIQFYSEELNEQAMFQLQTEEELRGALERGELLLLYQPVVDARTGAVDSMEALVRWQHPAKGLLAPAEFMPVAETSNLTGRIDEWVIAAVCLQMKQWREDGLKPFRVSVNVSARHLKSPRLVADLANAMRSNGLEPGLLELEITEAALLENAEAMEQVLPTIRALGVSLAIDDFGTGYSSLSSLKKLPIDTIKIDRSFIDQVCENLDDQAIVRATIGMAKSMDMRVVAEGVSSTDQAVLLMRTECDALQGYHLGVPMDAAAVSEMMRTSGRS